MEQISNKTRIKLSPQNFVFIIGLIISFVSMYYSLQAQIEEAKYLPPTNKEVNKAVIKTSNELEFIKSEITDIKGQLQVMDERLYEMQ